MQPKAKVKAKPKSAPMLDAQGRLTNVKAKPKPTVQGAPVPVPTPKRTAKPAPVPKSPVVQRPQPVRPQPVTPQPVPFPQQGQPVAVPYGPQPQPGQGQMWTGGTPGFDERTGQKTGQPEWMSPSGAYKGAPGYKPAKMKTSKW